MAKMIGNLIFHFKKYVVEKYGEKAYADMVKETSPDVQKVLSKPLLSNNWYDQKVYQQMMAAFVKLHSVDELHESSYYQVHKMLSGFYGLFAKFVSLKTMLSKADALIKKTWSEGSLKIDVSDDEKHISGIVSDFEFNDAHLTHLEHYFKAMIEEITGKKYTSSSERIDKKTTQFEYRLAE